VREVAKWYLSESVGLKTIAKRLRDRSIPSRRGKGWSFTSVRLLLTNEIMTGKIRFNVRRMQLDRKSGRRLPRRKATAEHLERQDESLRILDDKTFAPIQKQMKHAARGASPRTGRGLAAFTGLVYCACGSKCYRITSKNRKGSYSYYVCGRHLYYGDCPHYGRIREDRLVEFVKSGFQHVLHRIEEIVGKAADIAKHAVEHNRDEADRIKAEIAGADKEIIRLGGLLVDPDVEAEPMAKRGLLRRMAEAEGRREALQAALDGLRENANSNAEGFAESVRRLIDATNGNLQALNTPEHFNRFAEKLVGKLRVDRAGELTQMQLPAAKATGSSHLARPIAGACADPVCAIVGASFRRQVAQWR
jgi:hypothetical protein